MASKLRKTYIVSTKKPENNWLLQQISFVLFRLNIHLVEGNLVASLIDSKKI